jgi:RNA polymerase sigma-70 factor, ECF subfamily
MEEIDTAAIEELVRKIGMGDRASFEEFYARFSGLIYSTALKVLANEADAQDVAQDVLFMIWEKAPMYDPARGKPLTWAITMTRNKAIDRLRSQQRRNRLRDDVQRESDQDDFVTNTEPLDVLESCERGELLRSAVMKLSGEQREAIEMAYFRGLTQQEIASRLDEPLGTVKARIRRGMLRLKKIISSSSLSVS